MSDLRLTNTHDLDLAAHRTSLVFGEEAIAQSIKIKLLTFAGEWFLDTRVGIPMFRHVLVKNPNMGIVNSIYRKAITQTPGIRELRDLNISLSASTRTLSVRFVAIMDTGAPLAIDEPFIIQL